MLLQHFEHVQSKIQAVILVFLKNRNGPTSPTIRPIKLEKRDHHPTLLLPPGLQDLFFTFTMLSGHVQFKNGVDLVEVRIFLGRRRRVVKPFG